MSLPIAVNPAKALAVAVNFCYCSLDTNCALRSKNNLERIMVNSVSGINSPAGANSDQPRSSAAAEFQSLVAQRQDQLQQNRGGLLQPVLDPGPGQGPGRPEARGACETAAYACQSYAEQLHDRGHVAESQRLYQGCWSTKARCDNDDRAVQSWQGGFKVVQLYFRQEQVGGSSINMVFLPAMCPIQRPEARF